MSKVGKRYERRPNLTKKEARRAVAMINIDGVAVSQTMKNLGYSPRTAKARPSQLTEHPLYKEAENELRSTLKTVNPKIITEVAEQLNAGVKCDRTVTAYILDGAGDRDGRTEYVERPDHPTRLKYCEAIARLFGFLQDKGEGGAQIFNPQQFFIMVQRAERDRGLTAVEG